MPNIYGLIGLTETEYKNVRDFDKNVTWEAIANYRDLVNSIAGTTTSLLVQATPTIIPTDIHELHGDGEMDIVEDGAEYPPIDITGRYQTQYPVYQFGQRLNITRTKLANMPVQKLDALIRTVGGRYANARTNTALRALFNNAAVTVDDDIHGELTISPLANNDGTVYPAGILDPSAGVRSTLQAYNVSGNAAVVVADFTNAYNYMSATYGDMNGGIGVTTYVNPLMESAIRSLSGFIPVTISDVTQDVTKDVVAQFPELVGMQGKFIGRLENCNIFTWSKIPNNYILSLNPNAPKPVKMRVDEAAILGRGQLQILADMGTSEDLTMRISQWTARFGYGVANRLNGYITQVKASGSYDVPTFAS